MAITRPCIVGKMGSTKYYETTMTGRELAHSVRPAMELDSWASASIEERMQRKFDMKRIKETIVPYLAQHKDRFFGSLIVLVPEGAIHFEPLTEHIQTLPRAYAEAADKIGFLIIEKGELIALDGQHRLLAFREVVHGGRAHGEYGHLVGDDEVCVLFIEFESASKTRTIFNKVNRHAKPTGRSDNIITSEDDGNAIVTRWLLDEDRGAPLAARTYDGKRTELVNWMSNTLGQNSKHLTTISAVYETVKDILEFSGFEGFDEKKNPVAPSTDVLERAFKVAAGWWDTILGMQAFGNALADIETVAGVRYDGDHPHSLLLRPVGQVALVKGLRLAMERSKGALTLDEAMARADRIDWSGGPTSIWRDTIVRAGGKMVARKEAYELAAAMVAYLIGDEFMNEDARFTLWYEWNKARGKEVDRSVDEIADDEEDLIPEDLPVPVEA